ncbi:unnamed protein product [Lepidochelys kempii]
MTETQTSERKNYDPVRDEKERLCLLLYGSKPALEKVCTIGLQSWSSIEEPQLWEGKQRSDAAELPETSGRHRSRCMYLQCLTLFSALENSTPFRLYKKRLLETPEEQRLNWGKCWIQAKGVLCCGHS